MANKELNDNTTICDVLDCPSCKSGNTTEYNTDEFELSYDGTGHYFVDCKCNDCGEMFRRYINFKYHITSYH